MNSLMRWNRFPLAPLDSPLGLLRRATADVERLFDGLAVEPFFGESQAMKELRWTPSVDVIEKDDLLTIRVDLPGLTKDEVKVDPPKVDEPKSDAPPSYRATKGWPLRVDVLMARCASQPCTNNVAKHRSDFGSLGVDGTKEWTQAIEACWKICGLPP